MKQFADGLFIKNDDNGKPCHIGDNIKVIVEEGNMYEEGGGYGGYAGGCLPEDEYIGILVLLKSKGVAIRLWNGNYIFPRLTNKSIRKWKWERLEVKKDNT